MRAMRRLSAALAAVLATGLGATAAAAAAPSQGITVRPSSGSSLVLTAPAGGTRHTSVVVRNGTLLTNEIRLAAVDATTAPTMGTKYLTSGVATGPGSWLTLDLIDVTLGPQRSDRVALVLDVPPGTRPGQYVAGVVASATQDQPNGGASSVRALSIIPVQVNVPGATVHRLRVEGATVSGRTRLLIHLENAGNVVETPTGTATVSTLAGRTVLSRTLPAKAFLPRTSIDYPLVLARSAAGGRYRVAVALHYAGRTAAARPIVKVAPPPPPTTTAPLGGAGSTQTVGTTAVPTTTIAPAAGLGGGSFPWSWVAVAVLLLLLAGALGLFLRGRGSSTTVVTIPLPPPLPPAPAAPFEPPPSIPETAGLEEPQVVPIHEHYWQVRYDEPVLGADGVWRFPHVCRDCGLELLARDVADASALAASAQP
jgi:hypothetical protein